MAAQPADVIKLAEECNEMLSALMSHPKMNRSDPRQSPKPLFYAADFARTTYINYIMQLLPKDAQLKSNKIANKYIFPYAPDHADGPPYPSDAADDWLLDEQNWPTNRRSAKYKELYSDAIGRNMMLSMLITDPMMGSMVMGGESFDWERPVDIKAIAERTKGSG